jgi:predicted AAA+ superfamily ATPase
MEKYIYSRILMEKIQPWLFQGKVIIIYGPRQVGKTTLAKNILDQHSGSLYLNCERPNALELLRSGNLERIHSYIGDAQLVVFDEAQKVPKIGELLKLLIDTYPEIQYIATGSSSFNLISELSEPLTGRNVKFIMYPLSLKELSARYEPFQLDEKITELMRFGSYPDIVDRSENEKILLLEALTSDYLFRDVLSYENIRKSDMLVNLLKAVALQVGQEVSFRELSGLLKISVETVQKYLQLFEKSFVLFSLPSFSRNLRKEIGRSRKYYFYDLGIRNSLINNFNAPEIRSDTGQLWENFCVMDRIKLNQALGRTVNYYFWRTYDQKEIDFIEESEGGLTAIEFKWKSQKIKPPADFLNAYPGSDFQILNKENYRDFLM